MKKTTRLLFLLASKANWKNSLKFLSLISLGIFLSFSTLSATDYCHFAIQSTSATPQTAYITCQSLGGNQYEFKFETVNPITSWTTGSNFYSEVNGIGGTQVSNNLVKSSDSKTLTWTVTSTPKPNIYVANFTATFSDGAHTFNIPTDENFAAVCTIAGIPTLAATATVTDITTTTATSGGNITAEGASAVIARGVCWGTATLPTVSLTTKTVDGAGAGSFVSNITGLSSGVKYYVRAYATNTEGTAYGSEVNFTTLDTEIPTAFTAAKGAVGATTVELLLNATDNSGAVSYTISYGAGPTVVNTTGISGIQKSYIVTGLTESTAYTFSVVAKDAALNAAANNPIEVTATTTATVPTIAAPTPPVRVATDVLSIFSDAYTPVAGTRNYNPGWGQSGSASIIQVATNNTLKYINLNYQGTIIGSNVNATAMTHLHVDIWSANETSLQFFLVSTTSPSEKFVQLTPLVQNAWNSYDIPLTSYTSQAGFSMASIKELKVVGSGGKIVCLDNIYFYKYVVPGDTEAPTAFTATKGAVTHNSVELLLNATDNSGFVDYTITYGATTLNVAGTSAVEKSYVVTGLTPETAYSFSVVAKDAALNPAANNPIVIAATTTVDNTFPSVAALTPTVASDKVISLFSNAYTNVGVDTWRTDWSDATYEAVQIAGNDTKKYSNLVFVGIETTGANYVNATGMTHVHFDAWTPNVTSLKIKLVDFGANAAWGGGDDVEFELTKVPALSTWNSYNIPLSEFTGLTTRSHLAQYIFSGAPTGIVYIDNLYFYNDASTAVSKLTAENGINCYPNPIMNQLTINAKSEISQVIVRNLIGQTVISVKVNSLEKSIDLSTIATGNYFVTVKLANGQLTTQKVVKL